MTSKLVGPIDDTEVEAAIKRLQPGKAPGCDGLSADVLQIFFGRFFRHFVSGF